MSDQGGSSTELFVGNLVKDGDVHSEHNLRTFFTQFGTVTSIDLKKNSSGGSKGFCFVQFESSRSVNTVVDNYEHNVLGGVWLDCKKSVPR